MQDYRERIGWQRVAACGHQQVCREQARDRRPRIVAGGGRIAVIEGTDRLHDRKPAQERNRGREQRQHDRPSDAAVTDHPAGLHQAEGDREQDGVEVHPDGEAEEDRDPGGAKGGDRPFRRPVPQGASQCEAGGHERILPDLHRVGEQRPRQAEDQGEAGHRNSVASAHQHEGSERDAVDGRDRRQTQDNGVVETENQERPQQVVIERRRELGALPQRLPHRGGAAAARGPDRQDLVHPVRVARRRERRPQVGRAGDRRQAQSDPVAPTPGVRCGSDRRRSASRSDLGSLRSEALREDRINHRGRSPESRRRARARPIRSAFAMIVRVGCEAGRLGKAAPSTTYSPGARLSSPDAVVAVAPPPPIGSEPA